MTYLSTLPSELRILLKYFESHDRWYVAAAIFADYLCITYESIEYYKPCQAAYFTFLNKFNLSYTLRECLIPVWFKRNPFIKIMPRLNQQIVSDDQLLNVIKILIESNGPENFVTYHNSKYHTYQSINDKLIKYKIPIRIVEEISSFNVRDRKFLLIYNNQVVI